MTTYTFDAYKVTYEYDAISDTDVAVGFELTTFEIVFDENVAPELIYSILASSPGELPEVDFVTTNEYDVRVDGVSFNQSQVYDLTFFGEIVWDTGGGDQTTQVLALFDPISNVEVYVPLFGADPGLTSLAEFQTLDAAISSAGTASSPYGEGDNLDVTSGALATTTENDLIIGTDGDDFYDGGTGNDTIYGNDGSDTIVGGEGDDYLDPGSSNDVDDIRPGSGNDTIILSGQTNNYTFLYYGDLNQYYAPFNTGIVANLSGLDGDNDTIVKNGTDTDTLVGLDVPLYNDIGFGLFGTELNDTFNLTNINGDNPFGAFLEITGGDGVDTYVIDGRAEARLNFDEDTNFGLATDGLIINLATGAISNDGFGNAETITYLNGGSLARVRGTNNSDNITGSDADETFGLLGGTDTLDAGGGYDRLRYDQGTVTNLVVDLQAGTATGTIDWRGNVFAFNHDISGIERVDGSRDNGDTISGGGIGEYLRGRGGDDSLTGNGGEDTLQGDDGNDTLVGGSGRDELRGGDGNDSLIGGDGDDFLDDGRGLDYVDGGAGRDFYFRDFEGDGFTPGSLLPVLDLSLGRLYDQPTPGVFETILNVEEAEFRGAFDFRMIGDGADNAFTSDSGNDTLEGGDGNDYFVGFAGNDSIVGGAGDRDRVDYSRDVSRGGALAVSVDLLAGTATDGFGNLDTLTGIEQVRGTELGDDLAGDDNNNDLEGDGGNDTIDGRGGDDYIKAGFGSDQINGGGGFDTLAYVDGAAGGIQATFFAASLGQVAETGGTTDTFADVERIRATNFDDTLIGAEGRQSFSGEGGADSISGGGGDDDLSGNSGNDTLNGDAGFDFLQPGDGDDIVDGGADFDIISYEYDENIGPNGINAVYSGAGAGTITDWAGGTDTFTNVEGVYGTANADTLDGSASSEEMEFSGGAGGDSIVGGSGDRDQVRYDRDAEFGGTNGVNVNLGTGTATDGFGDTDTLSGIERVTATSFNDTLIGSAAREEFYAGAGNDTISGGGGDDYFQAGAGNDTVNGGANTAEGFDFISYYWDIRNANQFDGAGLTTGITVAYSTETDAIVSEDGFGTQDTLAGIEGLEGTEFADSITGAAGFQFFRGLAGNDTIDGGDGSDWASYRNTSNKGGTQGAVLNFITDSFTDTYGDTDTLISIENISGSDFGDEITGNNGVARELYGHGGNDTITGGDQNDTIDGGDGDDSLVGGGGNDSISGGVGADQIDGGAGNDVILGNAGNDTLNGGDGNDQIFVDGSGDVVNGGAGTDRVRVEGTAAVSLAVSNYTEVERVDGGAGNDTIDATGYFSALTILGGNGADSIIGSSEVDQLQGGEGNDIIFGGGKQDFIFGNAGADTMWGDTGNDQIFVDDTGDVVHGGDGTDRARIDSALGVILDTSNWTSVERIDGGAGSDGIDASGFTGALTVVANGGDDTIIGGSDRNVMFGNDGADQVTGGGDVDVLDGGAGADTMSGGGGDDVFFLDGSADVVNGGDGLDRARVANGVSSIDLDLAGWSGLERMSLSVGNDSLDASSQVLDMVINGLGGADDITGGSGSDFLYGNIGNDTLRGGEGDDFLYGDSGADLFFGGGGNDFFYIDDAGDRVADGGDGTDRAVLVRAGLSITIDGTWAGIERVDAVAGAESIDASGYAAALTMLGNAGADTLTGGSANDTIFGGSGADRLSGGPGGNDVLLGGGPDGAVDVFVFEDGAGTDRINDFENGVDLIDVTGIAGVTGYNDVTVTFGATNTTITAGAETIILQGITADIDAFDFV